MIEVDLARARPGFALAAAFAAPAGLTVLFGPSGSGKTSVLEAVAGLLRLDSGRVAVGGRVLFDAAAGVNLPPRARRIGYIFQDHRLFPHLTVAQNLRYGGGRGPLSFDEVVDLLGLGALLGRRPARLSGGEGARVAIGRALLSDPAALLADEPLAALDAARRGEILTALERLRDETGLPILYVTHQAAELARLATTVVLMEAGRVVAAGPAPEVLSDPDLGGAGAEAAGAVLAATIRAHAGDLTELAIAGGLCLRLPRLAQPPGARLRLHVAARDVMIATEAPQGLSALNVLPVRIVALRLGPGPEAALRLRAGGEGGAMLAARLTRHSALRLGLVEGREVFAVLKAVSVAEGNRLARAGAI